MRKSLVVLAVVMVILGGCQTHLMTTPAAVSDGHINPFDRVVPEYQNSQAPVFVASARTASGKTTYPAQFYTTNRSRIVRVGLATLEIGPGMTWDELVQESLAAKRSHDPVIRLAAYEEYGPLWSTAWPPNLRFDRDWDAPGVDRGPGDRFVEAIEQHLALSWRKQITVYVHGFNTRFDENLKRASEFWHYMSRDEVFMSFDWASKGSLFSYEVDKANANFAIRQFRELLEFRPFHRCFFSTTRKVSTPSLLVIRPVTRCLASRVVARSNLPVTSCKELLRMSSATSSTATCD